MSVPPAVAGGSARVQTVLTGSTSPNKKRPRSPGGRSRASKLDKLPFRYIGTNTPELLLTPLALSRSVCGHFRCSRQGFLTSGSNALASRPSQSRVRSVTIRWKLRIAGTQWREPSGRFTQLPLSPSMGTCDGPIRFSLKKELPRKGT